MQNKTILYIFLILIFLSTITPVYAVKRVSKICRLASKICILLDPGTQTKSDALQRCIDCCTQNITNKYTDNSEACFNFCTDLCSIKFTGKPVTPKKD